MSEWNYESPIKLFEDKVEVFIEDEIVKAVQKVGIKVDKDELFKALEYDREQYNKGYHDAQPKVAEWDDIQVFEVVGTTVDRLQSTFCPVCRRYHTTPYVYSYNHYDYCPNCGSQMRRRITNEEHK